MNKKNVIVAALLGIALLYALILSAGATAPSVTADRGTSALDKLQLVNLAHENNPKRTSGFPGDPKFTLTTSFTVPDDGFYLQYVKEGEHTGTHWAAPCHFRKGAACADDLKPRDLFLPAVVVDVRAKAAVDADYEVTVADLKVFESRYGRIPRGAAVIAWTGWGRKWGTPAYGNLDSDGDLHQPGFSLRSVRWLIRTQRLGRRGALGTDTFGPDPGTDLNYRASSLLLQRHRIDLENLIRLGHLPPIGAHVLVGGPINHKGSGSTATIWGLVPPSSRGSEAE
ncbi:MAG: cyclase family protein [Actinobacteria bacterium]|nr:cyclase family protein [Actinomycetota bacterium]